ncbi:MAG: DUF3459 domain-containing protein [Opitutales bacterium]|nr:DUF3459 domain-containing protein [Opitutales bacterium]
MAPYLTKHQYDRVEGRLRRLYGDRAPQLMDRFRMLLGRYGVGMDAPPPVTRLWDENDAVLITYADNIRREGEAPLETLRKFAVERLKGAVKVVHLLPFYPWSSDDGFSVIDYRRVEPAYGNWADVERLGGDFGLMFDLVLNHCSRHSTWFREFVTGIAPSRFYFHTMDPNLDLSAVVRPRPWPLLTKTATRDGTAWVWTTFSEDQVDLNWQNPDVLFEFLDILFLYISKGCRTLRLDAVAFLWKVVGTSCIHLPETHEVVKLFRDVVDIVAPETLVLTETNVPHDENLSYFGEGDEAHMVYNFALPPLLLHALLRNDATALTGWARGLPALGPGQTFFNFTASHDGIGVRPLQGILPDKERDWLAGRVRERGGRVSMKANTDGSQSPYELNITYCDALRDLRDAELGMARFLCSQAVALAFKGVPAVYIHSLLGTPNDIAGMEATGHNRSINRKKWELDDLVAELSRPGSRMTRIHSKYTQWLRRRANHPAFHPDAGQEVLDFGPKFFAFTRRAPGRETIVCIHNFTPETQSVPMGELHPVFREPGTCRDILSATSPRTGPRRNLKLAPYHAYWLVARG